MFNFILDGLQTGTIACIVILFIIICIILSPILIPICLLGWLIKIIES